MAEEAAQSRVFAGVQFPSDQTSDLVAEDDWDLAAANIDDLGAMLGC
jgi:hypothetical protein